MAAPNQNSVLVPVFTHANNIAQQQNVLIYQAVQQSNLFRPSHQIRNEIYRYLLAQPLLSPFDPNIFTFLLTCRAIHSEATQVIYDTISLRLESSPIDQHTEPRLTPPQRQAIRDVRIRADMCDSWKNPTRAVHGIRNILRSLARPRSCFILMDCRKDCCYYRNPKYYKELAEAASEFEEVTFAYKIDCAHIQHARTHGGESGKEGPIRWRYDDRAKNMGAFVQKWGVKNYEQMYVGFDHRFDPRPKDDDKVSVHDSVLTGFVTYDVFDDEFGAPDLREILGNNVDPTMITEKMIGDEWVHCVTFRPKERKLRWDVQEGLDG